MNHDEYKALTHNLDPKGVLTSKAVTELCGGEDRTLVYGYTCKNEDFHLYMKDGVLHRYIYGGEQATSEVTIDAVSVRDLVPEKRSYPAACDARFVQVLMDLGIDPRFTSWDDRPQQQYYGQVHA